MAPSFLALNRGKKSLVLDLKQEEDGEILRNLLREADVERALESKDGHDVWKRNVAAVEALGAVDMERRVRDCLT